MNRQELVISKWETVVNKLIVRRSSSLSLTQVHLIIGLLFDTFEMVQDRQTRARLRLLFDRLILRQASRNGRRH